MEARGTVLPDFRGIRMAAGEGRNRTLIHYGEGHNYADWGTTPIPVMDDPQAWLESGDRSHSDVDSFPPDYMDEFTRDPLPEMIRWDLSVRAPERSVESFYWLRAPYSTDAGVITALRFPGENRIEIQTSDVSGNFSILLNEEMVDFGQPILFVIDGSEVSLTVSPDLGTLAETTWERGDPFCQFEAEISLEALRALKR